MRDLPGRLVWVAVLVTGTLTLNCSRDGEDQAQSYPTYRPTLVQTVQTRSEGGLRPLYYFARSFLQAVQPNAFPGDLLDRVLKNGTEDQDIAELVHYEAGYLVCVFLALLYLLLMLLTGAFLLWMHRHRQSWLLDDRTSPSRYRKDIGVSGCLVLTTLLLFIGVILAFAANSRARANMGPSLQQLDSNVGIIKNNLGSIPQKMESVLEQFSIPEAEISRSIHEMNDTVGGTAVAQFRSAFQNALANLSTVVEDASLTYKTLQSMEEQRDSLQERQKELENGLKELNTSLQRLETHCPECATTDLTINADYNEIPSVKTMLDSIPEKGDIGFLVEESNQTFHMIPMVVSQQMAPTTAVLLSELNSTDMMLREGSKRFPSLFSLYKAMSKLRTSVRRAKDPLERYDHARSAVAITLCFVLLVTVVLLAAAVSLGLPVLFNPALYSRCPHAKLDRMALWLFQICILLICTFSWLYIILVFITLFFGGNAHTLLCQSFTSGEIFGFIDKQENLFSSLVDAQGNQSTQMSPQSFNLYHGCQRGESMFHSMEMNQTFDLEEFLDPSKYFAGFNKTIRSISVNTENLHLLSGLGKKILRDYRETGLETYNYTYILQLLNQSVVNQDLSAFASELDQKATLANGSTKEALQLAAEKARKLHNLVVFQRADAVNMSGSVKALKNISQSYKNNVNRALNSFSVTQRAMNTQLPLITANVSQCTLEKGEEQLLRYLGWARHTILSEVLECGWLGRSVDNMYTAVCLNVVDPWNGFWLSLGWCCAFLVPAVFLSLYVIRRLPIHPAALPKSFPAFTGKDYPDMSSLEKKTQFTEKKGDGNNSEDKSKSNIYMTLSELGDFNT